MAEILNIGNAPVQPRNVGDWVETSIAKDIQRSIDLVRGCKGPKISVIAGTSGSGKSLVAQRNRDQYLEDMIEGGSSQSSVTHVSAVKGEGTAWNFGTSLLSRYGWLEGCNSLSAMRKRVEQTFSAGSVLIVDDAQYLNHRNRKTGEVGEVFEWLRSASETCGFDLIFMGDMSIIPILRNMPSFSGRVFREVVIREVPKTDVAAFVAGTTLDNSNAVNALHAAAQSKGGLRNVENILEVTQIFAGDGRPDNSHLKAAIQDLKFNAGGMV